MWLAIIEKPSMPSGVTALLVNDTAPAKIKISWGEGFDGNSPIIRYTIQMRTLGPTNMWSEYEIVGETDPAENCCSYLMDNLRPSVTAEFRVIASNKHGPGKPSLPSGKLHSLKVFKVPFQLRSLCPNSHQLPLLGKSWHLPVPPTASSSNGINHRWTSSVVIFWVMLYDTD